jgi:hypothetical protein
MGAHASSSCAAQRDKLEQVVNVCCRQDKIEFSAERHNVYQTERNRYLPDADRKGSKTVTTSKWKPQQRSDACNHYENCCMCELEDAGQRSFIANADYGNKASGRRGKSEAANLSGAVKKAQIEEHVGQSESSENHHRMPEPPPGWTEAEMILLKRAVERAARTLRIKQPGFAAMQAIHARHDPTSHLRIRTNQLVLSYTPSRPFLRSSAHQFLRSHFITAHSPVYRSQHN